MTDRTLRSSADLDGLDFEKGGGLIPVVAQDADTGAVLMLGYAHRQALGRTLEEGRAWFFSRARQSLWMKGETSGNTLELVSLHADCDGDTVLARVRPAGPACHTGEATCFGEGAGADSGDAAGETPSDAGRRAGAILAELDAILAQRQAERPQGSYTVKLLDDENLRLKKLGEEAAELVTALAKEQPERIAEEAADLIYHVLVALRGSGMDLSSVTRELERRRG